MVWDKIKESAKELAEKGMEVSKDLAEKSMDAAKEKREEKWQHENKNTKDLFRDISELGEKLKIL